MAKIAIIRTDRAMPDAKALDGARSLLFGAIDGFSREDKSAWRRFWKRLLRLEPGEMAQAEMVFPRNGKFHRKLFALLLVGFEAWEPGRKHKTYKGKPIAKNFEQFREDTIILSGWFEQTFTLRGEMRLRAKSISYASMDDEEFGRLYSAVADVLLDRVLTTYKGREELDEVVDRIMRFQQ